MKVSAVLILLFITAVSKEIHSFVVTDVSLQTSDFFSTRKVNW